MIRKLKRTFRRLRTDDQPRTSQGTVQTTNTVPPLHPAPVSTTTGTNGTSNAAHFSNDAGPVPPMDHTFPPTAIAGHSAAMGSEHAASAARSAPSLYAAYTPPNAHTPDLSGTPGVNPRVVEAAHTPHPTYPPRLSPSKSTAIAGSLAVTPTDIDQCAPAHQALAYHPLASDPVLREANTGAQYFPNARWINVGQQNINHGNSVQNVAPSKSLFDYLEPHIAVGAAHNADERCDAPKCHPETRVAVQEEILGWITDGHRDAQPKKIMWVTGPAGTGKTAIAGSVAETCQDRGLLAASFFFSSFSGSANRRSKRCLVATLAHHLAQHDGLERYEAQLLLSIKRDPTVSHKRLKEQAEFLLLKPLRESQAHWDRSALPKVIIIDGLDEVEAEQYHDPARQEAMRTHEDDQREILDTLLTLVDDPAFPFCILIASRPERIIKEFFSATAKVCSLELFLDAKYNPDADIEQFLKSKFADIRRRYGLSASWPSQQAIKWIIDRASGQFVFAATVIRFVSDLSGHPQRQLEHILQLKRVDRGTKNPYVLLDALYTHILKTSPNPVLAVKWIRTITHFHDTSGGLPANIWRYFLETVEGEANYLLGSLTSLVHIPPPDDHTSHFRFYHKSFIDFLSDKHRCGDLYVYQKALDSFYAGQYASMLKNKGPKIPLSSPQELSVFLDNFISQDFALEFVRLMRSCLKDEHASESYDVTWWTRFLLTGSVDGADGCIANLTWCHWVLRHIYCSIHSSVCRESPKSVCHAACKRWRSGILAEARLLNYCVHKLELVDLEQLQQLGDGEWKAKFWLMPKILLDGSVKVSTCSICKPGLDST